LPVDFHKLPAVSAKGNMMMHLHWVFVL